MQKCCTRVPLISLLVAKVLYNYKGDIDFSVSLVGDKGSVPGGIDFSVGGENAVQG